MPSCLGDHTSTSFVPGLPPKARLAGRFLCDVTARRPIFVSCQLVKHAVPCQHMTHQDDNNSFLSTFSLNAEIFHYFH